MHCQVVVVVWPSCDACDFILQPDDVVTNHLTRLLGASIDNTAVLCHVMTLYKLSKIEQSSNLLLIVNN